MLAEEGLGDEDAARVVAIMARHPEVLLRTMVTRELGIQVDAAARRRPAWRAVHGRRVRPRGGRTGPPVPLPADRRGPAGGPRPDRASCCSGSASSRRAGRAARRSRQASRSSRSPRSPGSPATSSGASCRSSWASPASPPDVPGPSGHQCHVMVATSGSPGQHHVRITLDGAGRTGLRLDADRRLGLGVDHPVVAAWTRPRGRTGPARPGAAASRTPVKQSSHGPAEGGRAGRSASRRVLLVHPLGLERRAAPAWDGGAGASSVPVSVRRNHGCQPIETGIGSLASSPQRRLQARAPQHEPLADPAGERPVRPEVDRERRLAVASAVHDAVHRPGPVEDRAVDGVRRQRPRQRVPRDRRR